MTNPSRQVAGPRELVIASLIVGAILLAFWGGYELGKKIGRNQAAIEAAGQVGER